MRNTKENPLIRDSDKYSGEYSYDETKQKVSGCPARAGTITSFVKVIKAKGRQKGEAATRNHAEAMTIEDMKTVMDWSEVQVSSAKLEASAADASRTTAELSSMLQHGMMRAFMSSGYTLWTR